MKLKVIPLMDLKMSGLLPPAFRWGRNDSSYPSLREHKVLEAIQNCRNKVSLSAICLFLFSTFMTVAKAEEPNIPQGLVPPLYLDPPPESTLEGKSKGDADSSSGNGNSCGACGT